MDKLGDPGGQTYRQTDRQTNIQENFFWKDTNEKGDN